MLALSSGLFSCTSAHHAGPEQPEAQREVQIPLVKRGDAYEAQLSSRQVPDGSLVVLNVDFARPFKGKLTAEFDGKKFPVYRMQGTPKAPPRFEALFGVPHSHKPGPAELRIFASGLPASSMSFDVVEANYKSEVLKVEERKIKPHKKDMARIIREVAEINKAVGTETANRYWSGPFELPLQGAITDAFGTKRVYNGELKSYHGGIDFHAPMGTPIRSSGAGRVVLAKNLFFSGNTVMIDHGYGLITMYFHMSRIKVRKGQKVRTHQLLGLSGATGRVTGPHLHWQCDIHHVKINPMDLIDGSSAAELR